MSEIRSPLFTWLRRYLDKFHWTVEVSGLLRGALLGDPGHVGMALLENLKPGTQQSFACLCWQSGPVHAIGRALARRPQQREQRAKLP